LQTRSSSVRRPFGLAPVRSSRIRRKFPAAGDVRRNWKSGPSPPPGIVRPARRRTPSGFAFRAIRNAPAVKPATIKIAAIFAEERRGQRSPLPVRRSMHGASGFSRAKSLVCPHVGRRTEL
jgi:hypothetical protein